MHQEVASPSVKDVTSWPRKLVLSQSGQGSREVPGPSLSGRAKCRLGMFKFVRG